MLDALFSEPRQDERVYGVAVGIVTNNQDPDKLGRVKLRFPWLSDSDESNWARLVSPMAGPDRGMYFLPEVDDEVLVMFEHGRIDRPFVLGALWNGQDKPPAQNEGGHNNLRLIKSRSGHTITFDDTKDEEKITIVDRTGKNTLVIDSKENVITLTSAGDLMMKAEGNISLESSGGDVSIQCEALSIDARKAVSIKAGQNATVEAQSGLALKSTPGVTINDGAMEVR
jgi:uncharacterized protein involved in type VI secretion and phage assembly